MLCLGVGTLRAQVLKPQSISVGYMGEFISHPGLKLAFNYSLHNWPKTKTTRKGDARTLNRSLLLSPAIGCYYHKNYQTGFFFHPELTWKREKENGRFRAVSIGIGYLQTVVPRVYEYKNGKFSKTTLANSYVFGSMAYQLGGRLSYVEKHEIDYYIKPQLWLAKPGFPQSTGYFMFEAGLIFKVN